MIIKTQRLSLKKPALEQSETLARYLNDWEISQWLASPPYPYTIQDAETWLFSINEKPYVFGIFKEEEFIGVVDIINQILGYWLSTDYWGQGYMSEAVKAVVTYFSEQNKTQKIYSSYKLDNLASKKILANNGFKEVKREEVFFNSHNKELMIMRVERKPSKHALAKDFI